MATAVRDDEEAVQEPERRRRHGEQIHRGDFVLVVTQEIALQHQIPEEATQRFT